MARMLNLGAHAGLGLLQLFLGAAQRILLHGLAHAAFHRDVPGNLPVRVLRAFVGLLISSVADTLLAIPSPLKLAGAILTSMLRAKCLIHLLIDYDLKCPTIQPTHWRNRANAPELNRLSA